MLSQVLWFSPPPNILIALACLGVCGQVRAFAGALDIYNGSMQYMRKSKSNLEHHMASSEFGRRVYPLLATDRVGSGVSGQLAGCQANPNERLFTWVGLGSCYVLLCDFGFGDLSGSLWV